MNEYQSVFYVYSALSDASHGGPFNRLILQTETGEAWGSDDEVGDCESSDMAELSTHGIVNTDNGKKGGGADAAGDARVAGGAAVLKDEKYMTADERDLYGAAAARVGA